MSGAFGPISGESRVAYILSQFPDVPGVDKSQGSKYGASRDPAELSAAARNHLDGVRDSVFSMLRVQPQKQHLDAITKGSLALPPSTMNEAISSCIVGAARRHHKFNPKKTAVAKMKGSAAAAMGWLGRKLFGNNGEEDDPIGDRSGAQGEAASSSGPGRGGWDRSRRSSAASATSTYGGAGGTGGGASGGTLDGEDCGDCRDWSRPKVYSTVVPPELPREFAAGVGRRFFGFPRPRVRPVPASGPRAQAEDRRPPRPGPSSSPSPSSGGRAGRGGPGMEVAGAGTGTGAGTGGLGGELDAPVDAVDYPDVRLSRYAVALQCEAGEGEDAAALRFDFSALRAAPPGSATLQGRLPGGDAGENGGIASQGQGHGPRQRRRTLSQEDLGHAVARQAVAVAGRPPRSSSPSPPSLPFSGASASLGGAGGPHSPPQGRERDGGRELGLGLMEGEKGEGSAPSSPPEPLLPSRIMGLGDTAGHGGSLSPSAGVLVPVRPQPPVPCVPMQAPAAPAGHWVSLRLRLRNSGAAQATIRCRRLLDLSIPPECLGVLEGGCSLDDDGARSVRSRSVASGSNGFGMGMGMGMGVGTMAVHSGGEWEAHSQVGGARPQLFPSRTTSTEHCTAAVQVRVAPGGLAVDGHGGRSTLRIECKLREPGSVGSALLSLQVVGGLSLPLLLHMRSRRAARHAPLERLPLGLVRLPAVPELGAVVAMRRRSVASRRATAVSADRWDGATGLLEGGAEVGEEAMGQGAGGFEGVVDAPCCRVPVPACLCALWARVLEVPTGLAREGLFRTAAARDSRVRLRALVDSATGCGLPDEHTVPLPKLSGSTVQEGTGGTGSGQVGDDLGPEGGVLLHAMRHINASPVACAGEIKSLLRDLPRRLLDPPLAGVRGGARATALRANQARLGKELSSLEAGLAMLEHSFEAQLQAQVQTDKAVDKYKEGGEKKKKKKKRVGFAAMDGSKDEGEDEGDGEGEGDQAPPSSHPSPPAGGAGPPLDPSKAAAQELARVAIAAIAAAAGVDLGVWDRAQGEALAESRRSTELRHAADEALAEALAAESVGPPLGEGAGSGSIEEAMLEGAAERRGTMIREREGGPGKARPGVASGSVRAPARGGGLFKVQVGQGMSFLRGLGRAQARVLLWLVHVVRTVCARSSENRMSVRAMGIVLGPNLVTPPVVGEGGGPLGGGGGSQAGSERSDGGGGGGEAFARLVGEEDEAWEDEAQPDPAESLASARRCARLLELLAAC